MHWRPLMLCVAAGALLALVFPPYDAPWPCMLIALAAWMRALRGRAWTQALARTAVFGLTFQLALLQWMLAIGTDAWIGLSVLETLFLLPLGVLLARVRHALSFMLLAMLGYPFQDWVRDHADPVAFGWGQLSFATVDAPWMRVAPWMTQWTLTGLIAGIAAMAALSLHGTLAGRLTAAGASLLAIAAPLLVPVAAPGLVSSDRIALVQAGVNHIGIGPSPTARDVLLRHAQLTAVGLQRSDAELVVWPENALDVDPRTDALAEAILMAVRDAERPLLVGAVIDEARGRLNASLLLRGFATDVAYVKQRLVPFGEVMPYRSFMEQTFERVQFVPRDFTPGSTSGYVDVNGQRLGIVICFEIADERLVDQALAGRARALILQTNNATYMNRGQSQQQLRIAQVRALMFRVPVFMVSTTGPTAVIDDTGRIVQSIAEGATGILYAHLPANRLAT